MNLDLSNYEPKAKNWLDLNLRYEGRGSAEFASPEGRIEGQGLATFDECGSVSIEVLPESISIDPQYEGGPLGFLFGAEVQQSQGKKTMGFGGLDNPCKALSIVGPGGSFTTTGKVRLVGLSIGGKEEKPLRFHVQQAKCEVGNPRPARYFVMPLFNCVAELTDRLLGHHPLRIFPTPEVPASLSETDKLWATFKANEKNHVAGFFIDGQLCFMERLADYDARVAALKGGAVRRLTAVLVGDVANRPSSTLEEFWSWFPFELFSALSFASGAEVGLPWIEIRDEDGALIRRLHGRPGLPHFWEADAVLGQFTRAETKGAMGDFLTRYLAVPAAVRSFLEVAMDHARLGSLGAPLRLYDILDHLIRALECLCREHGFIQQDLLLGISDQSKEEIRRIVSEATKQIQQLRESAGSAGLLEDHRLLSTILGRAANIGTTEKKFGLAVVSLLESFGFPDADIIDRYFTANPRTDGLRDWASVVTQYRSATIHEGYMDFEKKHDINDVARICNHLKDVIARLILKEVSYDGTYDSPLLRNFGPQSISWVHGNTEPRLLGFA
jgi:hypothetical protein